MANPELNEVRRLGREQMNLATIYREILGRQTATLRHLLRKAASTGTPAISARSVSDTLDEAGTVLDHPDNLRHTARRLLTTADRLTRSWTDGDSDEQHRAMRDLAADATALRGILQTHHTLTSPR